MVAPFTINDCKKQIYLKNFQKSVVERSYVLIPNYNPNNKILNQNERILNLDDIYLKFAAFHLFIFFTLPKARVIKQPQNKTLRTTDSLWYHILTSMLISPKRRKEYSKFALHRCHHKSVSTDFLHFPFCSRLGELRFLPLFICFSKPLAKLVSIPFHLAASPVVNNNQSRTNTLTEESPVHFNIYNGRPFIA